MKLESRASGKSKHVRRAKEMMHCGNKGYRLHQKRNRSFIFLYGVLVQVLLKYGVLQLGLQLRSIDFPCTCADGYLVQSVIPNAITWSRVTYCILSYMYARTYSSPWVLRSALGHYSHQCIFISTYSNMINFSMLYPGKRSMFFHATLMKIDSVIVP